MVVGEILGVSERWQNCTPPPLDLPIDRFTDQNLLEALAKAMIVVLETVYGLEVDDTVPVTFHISLPLDFDKLASLIIRANETVRQVAGEAGASEEVDLRRYESDGAQMEIVSLLENFMCQLIGSSDQESFYLGLVKAEYPRWELWQDDGESSIPSSPLTATFGGVEVPVNDHRTS